MYFVMKYTYVVDFIEKNRSTVENLYSLGGTLVILKIPFKATAFVCTCFYYIKSNRLDYVGHKSHQ